jgi:hypothetical protein
MPFTAESAFQGREGIMAEVGPTGDGRATLFRAWRGNQAAIIPMSSSFQMERRPLGANVQSLMLKIKTIKILQILLWKNSEINGARVFPCPASVLILEGEGHG